MDLIDGLIALPDRRYEEWFRHAYELWLYRGPAVSRDDGARREGNGYFEGHENNLAYCPKIRGTLGPASRSR